MKRSFDEFRSPSTRSSRSQAHIEQQQQQQQQQQQASQPEQPQPTTTTTTTTNLSITFINPQLERENKKALSQLLAANSHSRSIEIDSIKREWRNISEGNFDPAGPSGTFFFSFFFFSFLYTFFIFFLIYNKNFQKNFQKI
jgi:hypothetical protein